MNISENIRRYRKKLDMTQAQLAQRLGVSVQAVSRWETGTGMPDTAQIVPLAQALNIKTDTLLCNRDRELEYARRWEYALRHCKENAELQKVCLDILKEDPENADFLFRAAMNESFLAKEAETEREAHFHWSMSRQYTEQLLRLDPDHESAKEHLVAVLSALGMDDEAVAQAHRCANSSRALLRCLKGEALRKHRQKRIDQKFRSLLNEIEQAQMPEVTEALIRSAIPDGNYQHYGFFLFTHGWNRAREHYACGNLDAVMAELKKLFDLARTLDESRSSRQFTVPLFDLLEGSHNPPGVPGFVEQFIHEAQYLFPELQQREDCTQLMADAAAFLAYTEKGTA